MGQLKKTGIIDKQSLSGKHYFSSLIEQAQRQGLLSDREMEKIQRETYFLLAKETAHYNNGNSSSVRIETAKSLLESILFTISLTLKTYDDPADAVEAICEGSLENLFEQGMRQIYAKIAATRAIHRRIVQHLFSTPNIYYRATVVDAIYGFFKLYCPAFQAQEIHITADYPTCNDVPDLDGIEFIRKYVGNLYYENMFCTRFPAKTIHHLLCGLHKNYQNLLINVYEPVLTAALACVLCGREIRDLTINKHDLADLQRLFADRPEEEITDLLRRPLFEVIAVLNLSADSSNYLKQSLPKIAATIRTAAATKTLDKVFLIPSYPEKKGTIVFSYGEKMDNDRYRQVIAEVGQCSTINDKIDVIKEEIRSLADLEDVLLDGDLSAETMAAVFQLLSPAEYAALQKHYPKPYDLSTLREKEKRLCLALADFTSTLPKAQQVWIEKTLKQMES